jgi:type II secretory pathway component GspD/PulD (secretin)
MFIPFTISRQVGESVGPGGERIPNQIQSQLFALRRVASGQTIVVGGVTNRQQSESFNGIPLLRDLPLIGPLFRSKIQSRQNTETLFFFTPTLLPEAVATGGEPVQ